MAVSMFEDAEPAPLGGGPGGWEATSPLPSFNQGEASASSTPARRDIARFGLGPEVLASIVTSVEPVEQ